MLLGIDVGNTQTVIGIYRGDELVDHWRVFTEQERTSDELALTITGFLSLKELSLKDVDGMVISSVVPTSTQALLHLARDLLEIDPLLVTHETDTGMPILYEDPRQVGADRLVNAVAAYHLHGGPDIIVDFGTATTIDAVSSEGEYIGGSIAPGIEISANALFASAARLPRVEMVRPPAVIGVDTASSMQAGIVFGFAGLVDRLVELFAREIEGKPTVIATGGLAEVVVEECRTIGHWDPLLTLVGLRLIYERNRGA